MGDQTGVSKTVTLIITTTASFTLPLGMSSVNVALPTMGREFAMEAVVMGWVTTIYTLMIAMSQVPFGRLADIYGRKRIFTIGLILFTFASVLCALANSVAMIIICRALQGIGSGMTFGTGVAILSSVFPARERGRALGINSAAVYVGLSIGPLIGGVMTQHLGWRSIFYLGASLGVVLCTLVFLKLKGEWAESRGEGFDVAGAIILAMAIAAGMYGFSVLPSVTGIALVIVGAVFMAAFVLWEARAASPILNVGLFIRNRVFVFSNLAVMITYVATFAVSFLLSLYLQYTKGFSPQEAGMVLITQSIAMAVLSPFAGRFSDRVEPRKLASVGMVFVCGALLMLIFLTDETGLGYIIPSLVMLGLGLGLFVSPNTNAIMGSVENKYLGISSGILGTMRTGGMILSMGIVMILFSVYIGDAEITPEYYAAFLTSVRVAFTVFVAICFAGIFAQLAGRRAGPGEKDGGAAT